MRIPIALGVLTALLALSGARGADYHVQGLGTTAPHALELAAPAQGDTVRWVELWWTPEFRPPQWTLEARLPIEDVCRTVVGRRGPRTACRIEANVVRSEGFYKAGYCNFRGCGLTEESDILEACGAPGDAIVYVRDHVSAPGAAPCGLP